MNFFSYEHFYVLYCKFWELDTDHDLVIDAKDLSAHDDHGKPLVHCIQLLMLLALPFLIQSCAPRLLNDCCPVLLQG